MRAYPTPLMFLAKQIANDTRKICGQIISSYQYNKVAPCLTKIEISFKRFLEFQYSTHIVVKAVHILHNVICKPTIHRMNMQFPVIADKYSIQDKEQPFRHITTDLHNYANPFIRYDTQDYVVLGEDCKCKCGRNMKNIKKIKGRDTDILVSPSGKYILMENIYGYFEDKPQILQIQVIQDTASSMNMNLVVSEECSNIQIEQIESYWRNFIGNDVDFQLI